MINFLKTINVKNLTFSKSYFLQKNLINFDFRVNRKSGFKKKSVGNNFCLAFKGKKLHLSTS